VARSPQQNIADSLQISEQLLFSDLDLAFTFVQCARVSSIAKTKKRNVAYAAKAYRDVSERSLDLVMDVQLRKDLNTRLALLKQQLAELGVDV